MRTRLALLCVYSRALIAILLQSYFFYFFLFFLRMRGSTFRSLGLKITPLLTGETQGEEKLWRAGVNLAHGALPTGTLPTPSSVFFSSFRPGPPGRLP